MNDMSSGVAPVCPFTRTRMSPWLEVPCDWRKPASDSVYQLYWSHDAKYGLLHPRPTPSEIASFYDVDYYTHSDDPGTPQGYRKPLLDRVREHLAWRFDHGRDITIENLRMLVTDRISPSLLEIGCGDGKLLAELQNAGWRVCGVDPDPTARSVAAQRGLDVMDGTAESPPAQLRKREFDIIVMQHVLEHCLDPLTALRQAIGMLRPGGVLVIETPNNLAASCRDAGPAWPWLDVPRHLNFFTARSLKLACKRVGLDVASVEYTGYTRQFQRPWLELEQRIRDSFQAFNALAPATKGATSAWARLVKTALARPASKYDSVRVVARSTPLLSIQKVCMNGLATVA